MTDQKDKHANDVAVSPVIAVMLLLVVVIVIAMVANAFSGSIAGSQITTAKTTVITAEFSAKGLLHLTNEGSNAIRTQDCTFTLTLDNQKYPLNSSMFWTVNGQTPEIVQIIQPQQTVMWGGVMKLGPGYMQPFRDVIGKTGRIEIFDTSGLPVAADEFVITE
jgi:hypothetical protein